MEKNDTTSKTKELSFEQALQKLEEIVERLSSGSANLEELVNMYETGISYLNQCRSKLEAAETKISILSKDMEKTNQKPTTEEEDGL